MNGDKYIPGVCNIGSQEINRRRRVGWIGLTVALLLLIILVGINVNPWWRLLIFFPATLSASGFLQAYFHFCAGFARRGVFNFGEVGKMQEIHDKDSNSNASEFSSSELSSFEFSLSKEEMNYIERINDIIDIILSFELISIVNIKN